MSARDPHAMGKATRRPARAALAAAPVAPGATLPASGAFSGAPAGALDRNKVLEHELHVHKFELESQNEELRRTQVELAAARDRFVDLYDFAPVGYFTVDSDDAIVEVNLTASAMLGEPRKRVLRHPFSHFIMPPGADQWRRFRHHALQLGGPQRLELELQPHAGAAIHVRLDCLRVVSEGRPPVLRVALTDVTQRKQAEMDREITARSVEAREAERRRVARELHEELGQRLSALKMELGSLHSGGGESGEGGDSARIPALIQSLDDSLSTVRRIAADLRPLILDDLGLNAAIDWLARDSARRLGLAIAVRLEETEPPLGESVSIAVYRMLQELLNHVARHANVNDIVVETKRQGGELLLTVQDNSGGWPDPVSTHLDMDKRLTLQHHARLLGGQLSIDEAQGGGRRFTVRIPLNPPAPAAPGPQNRFAKDPE